MDQYIRAGDLNQIIEILERPTTRNTVGEKSQDSADWTVWSREYASLNPTFGIERRESGKDTSVLNAVFGIRWRPSLPTTAMRVRHIRHGGSDVYEILAVAHVAAARLKVELTAKLVDGNS